MGGEEGKKGGRVGGLEGGRREREREGRREGREEGEKCCICSSLLLSHTKLVYFSKIDGQAKFITSAGY